MKIFEKIWISGAGGRLANEIIRRLDPLDYEVFDTDIDEVDITNLEEVLLFAERNRPKVIINCSAMTDPKECEDNKDKAFYINGLGARNIAIASNKINAKLIHLSTDDVFDGESLVPYREFDDTKPINIYGKSKLFGEEYVRSFSNKYFIIRSSWIYSKLTGKVEDIIEKARKGETIKVAKRQYAAPTSARELSKFIITLINTEEYGTYHAVCKGKASRADFARKVLEFTGLNGRVEEVEEVFNAIYRPDYTVLENFLLNISKLYEFPTWEEDLQLYIKEELGE